MRKNGWGQGAAGLLAAFVCVLIFGAVLWAQEPGSDVETVGSIFDLGLASIIGIVGMAQGATWAVKRYLGNWPVFENVPTFVYTLLLTALLVLIANRVVGTLEGDLRILLRDALVLAWASSGARSWWKSKTQPIADSQTARIAADNARWRY